MRNKRKRIKNLPGFLERCRDHPEYGIEHKDPEEYYRKMENDSA
jgi:hypothetical protein